MRQLLFISLLFEESKVLVGILGRHFVFGVFGVFRAGFGLCICGCLAVRGISGIVRRAGPRRLAIPFGASGIV
jgi:hypothetical protein